MKIRTALVGVALGVSAALGIVPSASAAVHPASSIDRDAASVFRFPRLVKPWQCIDPGDWSGPRRWTKAGAVIDCDSYNSRV